MTKFNKRSWVDAFLDKSRKALEIGSEAADVLVHLQGGVSPVGLAAVGMRVVNSLREHRAKNPEEYFGDDWIRLDLGLLEDDVYQSLAFDPAATLSSVPGIRDERPAVLAKVDGLTIGFALNNSFNQHLADVRGCWIPKTQSRSESARRVGRALWDGLKSPRAVLTPDGDGQALDLVAAEDEPIFPSLAGDELYERMKKFLDRGFHRSAFVLGDPGSGKTELLRYVASLHGGFLINVKLGDLRDMNGTALVRVVEILSPDVMIIDDFDRLVMGEGDYNENAKRNPEAAALLDPIERINKIVPLFMVSANFSEQITSAMLRPGRFDEIAVLEQLDPEIYRQLLPDAPEKVVAELKRVMAPVAYVQELRKRVEVLGYEDAVKEMASLMKRSDLALRLNKKRSKAKKRSGATLVGKSPRQRAGILEQRASRIEKKAGRSIEQADKERVRADDLRRRAEEERKKAAAHDAKVKAKTRTKARKTKK